MNKKLYFLNIDSLEDFENIHHSNLTDEEWKMHSEIVYDTIEEFCADYNSEMAPYDGQYFVRYI